MQPTSPWFIALLALATVGAAVAAVLTWDRPRGKRVRRVVALLGTQALVVLTGLALVNSSQGFFTAWSDISGGSDGKITTAGPVQPGSSGSAGGQLADAIAAAHQAAAPGRGVMVSATITGARTGYRLPLRLYLPAAYFDPAQSTRTFPVVMFFNGFLGGVDTFQKKLGADAVLDRLIAERKMPPVVAVVPEKNPSRPADSECIDAVRGDRADTYVSYDVTDVVKAELRVSQHRAGWAAMGYSTGGYCAVNLALRHPDVFGAAASLSGNYRPYEDATTGDLFHGDRGARRANTPVDTISARRAWPLRFYLFVSRGDPIASRELREFAPKVRAPDTATVVQLDEGGHNYDVWRRTLPGAFTWVGQALRADGGATPTLAASPHPAPPASVAPRSSADDANAGATLGRPPGGTQPPTR